MEKNPREGGWRIDKGIRLDLVVVLGIQFFMAAWFLSDVNTRVKAVEENVSKIQVQMSYLPERIAVVETKTNLEIDLIQEVKNKLQQITK